MRCITVSHLFLSSSVLASIVAAQAPPRCRCLYGESCWPSQAAFDALASQVSQPLVHPIPPATPCYAEGPNSPACAAVVAGWNNGNWRSDQPGAMQNINYETFEFANGTIDACYFNTTIGSPCLQGSVSIIGVDARTPADVQAAVKFAKEHNLRLVVKNTGHDYLGRSDGRGSFMIWTHHMQSVTVHPSFQPTGAPSSETYDFAITLEAGVQWGAAYDAVAAVNRTIVGANPVGPSIGAAGGWLMGGGHSALTPTYGLGVDNVLEITLVTAHGTILTVNSHQHPDLFWALRGGGGGTFGVITSLTYRSHPSPPVVAGFLVASQNGTTPNAAMSAVYTELVRCTPALTDFGWGGYTGLVPNTANNTTAFGLLFIASNVSLAAARASVLGTLLNFMDATAAASAAKGSDGAFTIETSQFVSMDNWAEWSAFLATNLNTNGEVGANAEIGSRLISRDVVEANYSTVAQTILDSQGRGNWYLVAGGAATRIPSGSTGLNPAWRSAVAYAIVTASWPEGADASQIASVRDALRSDTAKLRALAPQSGAYFNEGSLYELDPAFTFFGNHYSALRAIKTKYDPDDLFVVAEGVGSEDWDKALTCRV